MESSKGHLEAGLSALDDQGFLDLLAKREVKLLTADGQLRVTAAPGVLTDELRDELKRRKTSLVALLNASPKSVDDLRKLDLGVRARRRISPAGQWTPHLQYWKTQLEGVSGFIELPFGRSRHQLSSISTEKMSFRIPAETLAELKRLGADEGASLETLLFAAFCLLVHRYTGKTDFCVGLPKMRRQRKKDAIVEDMVENTICLRCAITEGMTFQALLGVVNQAVHEAYMHSSLPLARLLSVLPIESQPNSHPLFQFFFAADLSGVSDPNLMDDAGAENFLYDLSLCPDGELQVGGDGHIRYRKDLYAPESIALFAESYVSLLQDVATKPDSLIADINLLSNRQRHQMLDVWNQTDMVVPEGATIHSLFEQTVREHAGSVALIQGDKTVTYEELNARANQIAHFLLAKRIPYGSFVGICMRRSVDMVASMLAVLKAGLGYLPLDPVYPAQRLEGMLADSQAELVLADAEVREPLAINERKIARIDMDEQEIRRMPASNPQVPVQPSDIAYLIYTSGSTGRPKGVAIEHHSTVSFLTWGRSLFKHEELARVFAATSICFDLSIFEVFLPLTTGGAVVLADDFLALARMGTKTQPTLLNTVPSAISSFLASSSIPQSVRCINLAGEPLSEALVDQVRSQSPGARIFDLYGPTETTTYSTVALRERGMSATIGRPLANTKIFILDSNMKPVPPEVPGQILIGGEGVAREYLYRPELTAAKFVSVEGLPYKGRLYATGDLGRFKPDGSIEYLGRMDNQVKIRGFRVELGEIENTLQQHLRIRDAAVIMRPDERGAAGLVAFVTISSGPVYQSELVAFQHKFLPAYMVVNNVVMLEALPTTLNGKIDRKALATMEIGNDATSHEQITPSDSELQHRLRDIWEKNFKRKPIGIDDDFFALGGHSLLAFQIFNEIEKTLKITMMLSVLFKAPTIRLLAEEIEKKSAMETQYALH